MGAVTEYLNSYTHHLDQMAEMAQQLEGTKTMASLARHSYASADLAYKTSYIQMLTSHLNLLYLALQKESENYQERYQAAHPGIFHDVMTRCQELKDTILGNSMQTIKKILRSKSTPSHGIRMHQPYPESAFTFCEAMLQTRRLMTQIMLTCRNLIQEENDIKLDADRCQQIYNDCYKNAVQKNQPFIHIILKTHAVLDPSEPKAYELACLMKKAKNWQEVICQGFHAYDDSSFQLFVVHDYAERIRCQQRQSQEQSLWADNEEMTRKVIHVMENFDRLGDEVLGRRQKANGNKHAIKAKSVLMLYRWCTDRGCQASESRFVSCFRQHYKGAHNPPTLSSVNGKKNRSAFTLEEFASFAKKVDRIAKEAPPSQAAEIPIRW